MPRHYYYFAASLPNLVFEAEPPISLEEFISEARRHLTASDFCAVRRCVEEGAGSGQGAARKWQVFEDRLRNEWAAARAPKKGLHASDVLRGERALDPVVTEVVAEALDEENPLKAQRMIDRLCWSFLDELEAGHLFDADRLVVYGLKLKILERYQAVRSPRGGERLEALVKSDILEETLGRIRG